MTVRDVFEMRRQGRIEEAYAAIRLIYKEDKGAYASIAMFWTAYDMLKQRLHEDKVDEAVKICLALERMMPNVPDHDCRAKNALSRCRSLVDAKKHRQTLAEEGPEHMRMGVWGEELAAAYLREKGYVILERDWHSGHRDIDIIARKNDTIVFVEVKTRHDRLVADPLQAVNSKKLHNLRLAINHYISYHHIDAHVRFDVITVVGQLASSNPEINHIEDIPLYTGFQRRY